MTDDLIGVAVNEFDGEIVEDNELTSSGSVINFSDLDGVPDNVQPLIPVTRNVHLRIADAKAPEPDSKGRRKIDICWQLVEGVPVGEVMKFKNSRFWQRGNFFDNVMYDADLSQNTSDYWTEGKYKQNLKALMAATQCATIDPNDLRGTLIGRECIGNVVQVPHQTFDEEKQDYVDDGTFTNCVRYFKAIG